MTFKELKIKANELALDGGSSLAEHRRLAAAIERHTDAMPEYVRPIRAALLGSFTIQGLGEALVARGLFHNLRILRYEADYNQFAQEILGEDSGLYRHDPEVVYLLIDAPDILSEEHLERFLELLLERTTAEIVIADFIPGSPGSEEKALALSRALHAFKERHDRMHVFDLGSFVSREELGSVWYTKYVALGDLRIAPHVFPQLAEALLAYAVSRAGVTRKCLVADLDGTLWSGVIGEDGYEHIVPHDALHEHILTLYEAGTILTMNSKNNEQDALEAFERRSDMRLHKDHFATWRINWSPKDQNVRAIAEELNIGTDSMVFIDDEPFQQHLVLHAHPEIAVLHPKDLGRFSGFFKSVVTAEDLRRSAMYAEERKRNEAKAEHLDENSFLQSLGLRVSLWPMREEDIERVAQLTQKTNQYNMTTRRHTASDVSRWREEGGEIFVFRVNDAFGDYGIVGACFVKYEGEIWHLENFLMSCRVIGRGVERSVLSYVFKAAETAGVREVTASFIPSKKNAIAARCYPENGFKEKASSDGEILWTFTVEDRYEPPSYVTVIETNE